MTERYAMFQCALISVSFGLCAAVFASTCPERTPARNRVLHMSCGEIRSATIHHLTALSCDDLNSYAGVTVRQYLESFPCDDFVERAVANAKAKSCSQLDARTEKECEARRSSSISYIRSTPCEELRKEALATLGDMSCAQIRLMTLDNAEAAPCADLRGRVLELIDAAECGGISGLPLFAAVKNEHLADMVQFKLPHAIEIAIPRSWVVFSADQQRQLDAETQRLFDLSGMKVQAGRLLSAKSPLDTSYAYLEVISTPGQTYSQPQVASLSETDLQAYDSAMHNLTSTMLKNAGFPMLSWFGTTREKLGDSWALVSRYRRADMVGNERLPKGPIHVSGYVVSLGSRAVSLTVSYTELKNDEGWQTMTQRIASSLWVK